MKYWLTPVLLLAAAAAAFTAKPGVSREAVQAMEVSFDKRIQTLNADIPFELLGNTRGVYLEGYGVVFTSEVNLSQSTNVSPFQLTIPREIVGKLHIRKLERVPILKKSMQQEMVAMASSLDAVPPNERIVLGVTLYYHKWEDTSGLPSQIVMQAERQKLVDVQLGRASADSVIRVQEL
jgi:RAB protein geranylgeranyltransferase component A